MSDPKGRSRTPMEQAYPTICAWVGHQTVSMTALREELRQAVNWTESALYQDDPSPHPEDCRGCQYWDAPIHLYRPLASDDASRSEVSTHVPDVPTTADASHQWLLVSKQPPLWRCRVCRVKSAATDTKVPCLAAGDASWLCPDCQHELSDHPEPFGCRHCFCMTTP